MSYGAIAVPICKYFNIVLPNYFLVYKFKILIYSQQTINFVNEMKNTLDTTCKCLESLKLIEELDDCKEFVLPFQEISPFGCLISLSSGTTGKPKQILLSQYTILHFLREDHIL
jgi:acyl-coenzyme A synthetase/AMP-(fatty) acid ligase